MINRVLIRMKTVQLLYSYLLVEKPFSLESSPSAPTKEKRFAYQLYLDLLYLMAQIAGDLIGKNHTFPLKDTRFIRKIEDNDQIKSLKIKYKDGSFPFAGVKDNLVEKVKQSLLFKEFEKNKKAGEPTDDFWENVFNSIIIQSPEVGIVIKNLPGYSLSGIDRMSRMMEDTFKTYYATRDNIDDALKILEASMRKARDLYMLLLALPVELTQLRLQQLENNRRRLLATTEDLNPNMRFVNNLIPEAISSNKFFEDYTEKNHLSWKNEDPELLEILLKDILNSEIYARYVETPAGDIKTDSDFWRDIIIEVILNNEAFLEYLENKSVFWNDDLEIMASFVLKTLKRIENPETSTTAVMPMYKDGPDGKDSKFGAELFRFVVRNKETYRRYIDEALMEDKWESERLAFMDVVIMMTAIAEIINYPEIPLSVSINEYIEIAKSYSSAKSGQFINGLLAGIINNLKENKIIYK